LTWLVIDIDQFHLIWLALSTHLMGILDIACCWWLFFEFDLSLIKITTFGCSQDDSHSPVKKNKTNKKFKWSHELSLLEMILRELQSKALHNNWLFCSRFTRTTLKLWREVSFSSNAFVSWKVTVRINKIEHELAGMTYPMLNLSIYQSPGLFSVW
jgi:hypothetical protein